MNTIMNSPIRELPLDEIPERLMEIPEPPKNFIFKAKCRRATLNSSALSAQENTPTTAKKSVRN